MKGKKRKKSFRQNSPRIHTRNVIGNAHKNITEHWIFEKERSIVRLSYIYGIIRIEISNNIKPELWKVEIVVRSMRYTSPFSD